MPRFLDALSRKTTSGRLIQEIDGLRFVAIFLVAIGHLRYFIDKQSGAPYAGHLDSDPLARLIGRGHVGVQIFFAISGFILALPFASAHLRAGQPAPSLRSYFLRRLTRLEPPYLIALVLLFVSRVVFQHASATELMPHLLASSAYVHNVVYAVPSTINAVAWSLEVEIQFYLLVPLLAQVFRIRSSTTRRLVTVGATVAVTAVRALALPVHTVYGDLTIVGQLQFFLVGFLVADLFLTNWEERPHGNIAFDLLAWTALAALLLDIPERHAASTIVFPLFVFAIAYGAFRGLLSSRALRNPYISTIGGMCYSIYLLHAEVITAIGTFFRRWVVNGGSFAADIARLALVALPLILAVSVVYFIAVERPCMDRNWPRDLWRKLRPKGR